MNDNEHQPTHDRIPGQHHDRQVDAALQLLRQTMPPAALEQRMLQRLSAPAGQRSAAGLLPSVWRWAAFAGITAAVLAVAFVSLYRQAAPLAEQTRAQQTLMAETHVGAPLPTHIPDASSGKSAIAETHIPRTVPAAALGGKSSQPAKPRPLQPRPKALAGTAQPLTGTTQTAAEFDRPAPELPLTAQERLLLRIAYGDRPQQMAANKRFVLPRSNDDDTDFNKFFEPYTTPLTEGLPQ